MHDKTVYVSGQLGMDPKTSTLLDGDISVRAVSVDMIIKLILSFDSMAQSLTSHLRTKH